MATFNFNVDQFKAALKNGGARPNQFTVILSAPNGLAIPQFARGSSQFLITATELPGQSVNYTPVFYRGREVKLSGDRQLQPIGMTILNDTEFTIRQGLEFWLNNLDNMFTKEGLLNPSDYQGQMQIIQLDRNGVEQRTYDFQGVFPTEVGPVGLDYSSNDVISSFGATFQYQTFRVRSRSGLFIA